MDKEAFAQLPASAFKRGITRLKRCARTEGVIVFGFDCEYDSKTQEIVCYQISDGTHSELRPATKDLTLPELSKWAMRLAKRWGHDLRGAGSILLVSHYSAAELSHVARFWMDGEVRRVSPQQVFNVTHHVNTRFRVTVFDMFHFFNTSLAKVAKTFGYAKLDYDTSKVSRRDLKDPHFHEYAVNDAVLCANIFKDFRERVWSKYEIDVVRYCTPASLAMAVYRKHWLGEDVEAPAYNVRRIAWLCLWGGRSEAYVAGDRRGGPWWLRDVKSLYPRSAELVGKLPRREDWVQREAPLTYRGFCVARFSYPDTERFPALPVFAAGRLVFPRKGTTWCTLFEAEAAEKAGAVLEYKTVWEYTDGDGSLAAYMTHFTASKDANEKAGNKVDRELDKLLMNALIGKLSQHKGDVDVEDAKKAAKLIGVPLETVLDPQFHHPDKPQARPRVGGNVMPEWSALILGKARAVMGELNRLVALEAPRDGGDDALVMSTDSLLVDDAGDAVVTRHMAGLGVLLTNKNENRAVKEREKGHACGGDMHRAWCCACPDPAPVTFVRVVRTRVYAGCCPHGVPIWSATHALHVPKRDNQAVNFILGDEGSYTKRDRAGLKTAARTGVRFQSERLVSMRFNRGWDEKRRRRRDGTTEPWASAAHAEKAMAAREKPSTKKASSGVASIRSRRPNERRGT